MARCTGECCVQVWLWKGGRPLLVADICAIADLGVVDVARLKAIFLPMSNSLANDYRCRALTPTGCCLPRVDRPEFCNTFPYGDGHRCEKCGARSDAEARGVALQRMA